MFFEDAYFKNLKGMAERFQQSPDESLRQKLPKSDFLKNKNVKKIDLF